MIVLELIKAYKKLIEIMEINHIKVNDIRLIPLMAEWEDMIHEGYKRTYIISHLSQKYKISERTIYLAIKRVTKHVKTGL